MASPGGDRGRDAELYVFNGEPGTMFQFAVRSDWNVKINETLKKLAVEFPSSKAVVFLSSHQIGAQGDGIRKRAREQGIALDIRDRSWFVERVDADDSRNAAAAELERVVVDPFLVDRGIVTGAPALEGAEARTALVFLELQARDDNNAKGLTKSCFESLVKAALQGTTAKERRSREVVRAFVAGLLPQHGSAQLVPFVDAALKRLERSVVKHYQKQDEFHLSHEEVERTKDRVAGLTLLQDAFSSDARDIVGPTVGANEALAVRSVTFLRTIIETYFYRLGEEFAQSVAGDREIPLHADLLRTITLENSPSGLVVGSTSWADFLHSAAASLIANPSPDTLELFRVLSTAYTLFAFLAEVPDVQAATKKLFEHGTLWFDTTVLLP